MTDCGAVSLAAAILEIDVDRMKLRFGLPTKIRTCKDCGAGIYDSGKYHRCEKCRITSLACEECERIVVRKTGEVVYRMGKRNYQHVWCGRHCFGKWLARNYGFTKGHRIRSVVSRKWSRANIKQLSNKGYDTKEISELMGAPIGSMYNITTMIRKRQL